MVKKVTVTIDFGSNEWNKVYCEMRRNEEMLRKQIRMEPLITLLRSMNRRHRKELGDFLCFCSAAPLIAKGRSDGGSALLPLVIEQNKRLEEFLWALYDGPVQESPLTVNLRNAFLVDDSSVHRWKAAMTFEGFLRCAEKPPPTPFSCIRSFVHSVFWEVKVDLSRNSLGDRGAVEVCEALKGLPNLEHLDISHNNIGDEGAKAICTVLLSHPTCRIETLDCSWNWGMGSNTDELARVLRYENRSLVELDLSGASADPSFALANALYDFSDGCRLLDIPEKYNHHLQVLKCSKQPIAAKTALRAALKMNKGDWYEDAIARKIDHHLSKGYDEILSGDGHHISRCLEVVGKHGSDKALFELVQRYLFGTS